MSNFIGPDWFCEIQAKCLLLSSYSGLFDCLQFGGNTRRSSSQGWDFKLSSFLRTALLFT